MLLLLLAAWCLAALGVALVIGAAVRLADARDPVAWAARPLTTADVTWVDEPVGVPATTRE